MSWRLLILSLPTENAAARMRAWRVLKAAGAAVLRDGAYLLPDREPCRATLDAVGADVRAAGGTAYVMEVAGDELEFVALFDRSEAYAGLLAELADCRTALTPDTAAEGLKRVRKLRKAYTALAEIDFFPGAAGRQTAAVLSDLEGVIARALSPDEPQPTDHRISARNRSDYRGRVWATRRRPWVDRLASAWLIRRYIDPDAQFLWLASPGDLPAHALGFDFDGAAFTHVGDRVTFETLLESFALEGAALQRIAALVHYLDVGGIAPPDAAGVERVLAGLRNGIDDDDRLLQAAEQVFDGLLRAYEYDNEGTARRSP